MPLTFRCYTDPNGRDVMREWYDARDGKAQGHIVGVAILLESNARARSDKKLFKALEKRASSPKCIGFHEILIDFDQQHFRIIGFLENDTFTMLCPMYKNISPKYAAPCVLAIERWSEILNDRGRAQECEFPPTD
jgi:hypothetical protein